MGLDYKTWLNEKYITLGNCKYEVYLNIVMMWFQKQILKHFEEYSKPFFYIEINIFKWVGQF